MKKKSLILIMVIALVLPMLVLAKPGDGADSSFKSLNLRETLKAENIEEEFTNYSENSNQITIYMFRGDGCPHCTAFLSLLNSIADEGKFKLRSYEVNFTTSNFPENTALAKAVAEFLGQEYSGVPLIIIGDEVIPGYIESWADTVKASIDKAYSSSDRYDVFDAMREAGYKFKNGEVIKPTEKVTTNLGPAIICNLVFTLVSTGIILIVSYCENRKLNIRIDELEKELKRK